MRTFEANAEPVKAGDKNRASARAQRGLLDRRTGRVLRRKRRRADARLWRGQQQRRGQQS